MEFYFGAGGPLRKALRELTEKAETLLLIDDGTRNQETLMKIVQARSDLWRAIGAAQEVLPKDD
jgi:hypothetical protein